MCYIHAIRLRIFYDWILSRKSGFFKGVICLVNIASIADLWRRERDSNPRRRCRLNGFQVSNVGIIKINKDNKISILYYLSLPIFTQFFLVLYLSVERNWNEKYNKLISKYFSRTHSDYSSK